MMADVNITVKVPGLEKLLDYTASGIGAVAGPMLAPWQARQRAEAKLIEANTDVASLRTIANAQAEARQILVPRRSEFDRFTFRPPPLDRGPRQSIKTTAPGY